MSGWSWVSEIPRFSAFRDACMVPARSLPIDSLVYTGLSTMISSKIPYLDPDFALKQLDLRASAYNRKSVSRNVKFYSLRIMETFSQIHAENLTP